MSEKILVVGAQSVLGSFTARYLRDLGYTVLRGGRRAESADDFRLIDLVRPTRAPGSSNSARS